MAERKNAFNTAKNTAIYLFRNDLRIHDNEVLLYSNQNAPKLLPLYCFDPRHFSGTYHHGFPKTGGHRLKFLLESVKNLRCSLQKLGSDLVVRQGQPEVVIKDLVKQLNLNSKTSFVALHKEVTDEELNVEKAIEKESSLPLRTFWGHTLYHIEDLPFGHQQLPDVYTQFRKRVEEVVAVRDCFVLPDKLKSLPECVDPGNIPTFSDLAVEEPSADNRSAFPFSGGETSGLERLDNYFWGTDSVTRYKETRNGMIGPDFSTKFSPWLAYGCLSPRKIYWEIKRYEKERTANQSTYWVIFELLWRDYFRFVAQKFGNKLFASTGLKGEYKEWKDNMGHFLAWKEGRTGVPYIDANMRELAATGFMSNRGRQNVASFLTKDLCLDWRLGAEWFESCLVDHDVCSNYGNWLYSAGLGNDPRENRKFNVVKQGLDYDGDGEYVRLWVPELAGVKTGKVHCVWTLSDGLLRSAGVELGVTYPKPIVIAPEWSRHVNRPASNSNSQPGGTRGQATHSSRGLDRGQGRGQSRGQGQGRGLRRDRHEDSGNTRTQYPGQKRGLDFYFSSASKK